MYAWSDPRPALTTETDWRSFSSRAKA